MAKGRHFIPRGKLVYAPSLHGVANVVSVFTPEECEELIALALMEDGIHEVAVDENESDKSIRSVMTYTLSQKKYPGLWERLQTIFEGSNSWRFEWNIIRTVQILRFREGDHLSRSMDWSSNNPRRKISMVLQLSEPDEYEGGDVVLSAGHMDNVIPTNIGFATLWASYLPNHVTPVTSGERWCIVAWAEGEPYR
jgi:PKHD-type hydroxylase